MVPDAEIGDTRRQFPLFFYLPRISVNNNGASSVRSLDPRPVILPLVDDTLQRRQEINACRGAGRMDE